jgi:hypothetical protein
MKRLFCEVIVVGGQMETDGSNLFAGCYTLQGI